MTPILSAILIATTIAISCGAFAIIISTRLRMRRMRRAELSYVVIVGVVEEPAFKDALDAARGWVRE